MHYIATFHPQVWINDHAHEADPLGPTQWDACAFFDALPEAERGACRKSNTEASDRLREDPAAPQWIQEWSGPFYISIQRIGMVQSGLRHELERNTSAFYDVVFRVEVNPRDTYLCPHYHARAVAAYLEMTIGHVLRIDHVREHKPVKGAGQTRRP